MTTSTIRVTFERLRSTGLAAADATRGCTKEEIAEIESTLRVRLPNAYREFLRLCGKQAGEFLLGTDWTFPTILALKESAAALLRECDVPRELSPSAFVFAMHQGYQFLFFDCQSGQDPAVFRFIEGDQSARQVFDSFSNWFRQCAEDEIAAQAELNER
ncbi:MAG TPA: SMI1/KNR4 family protein [Pirellulales bacterium]|nr:SMI1/KNR4 family protein [Pirellulales bacterium]